MSGDILAAVWDEQASSCGHHDITNIRLLLDANNDHVCTSTDLEKTEHSISKRGDSLTSKDIAFKRRDSLTCYPDPLVKDAETVTVLSTRVLEK